jgi:hypothetical protein
MAAVSLSLNRALFASSIYCHPLPLADQNQPFSLPNTIIILYNYKALLDSDLFFYNQNNNPKIPVTGSRTQRKKRTQVFSNPFAKRLPSQDDPN